ncbi:MAG: hypothetical protein Q9217_005245 [Psora testacea]
MDPKPNSAARWQLVPDRVDDPKPNSKKTLRVDQEWFDQYNWIRRSKISLGCNDPKYMETYSSYIKESDTKNFNYYNKLPPTNLQKFRSSITICDIAFDEEYVFQKFPEIEIIEEDPHMSKDFSHNYWRRIMPGALLHEATHTHPFRTRDVAGEKSHGWKNIMELNTTQSISNADNYMHLALLATLGDWGIRLDEDQDKAKAAFDLGLPYARTPMEESNPPKLKRREIQGMSGGRAFSAPAELRYIPYNVEKEATYLSAIRQLMSKDLSEPYSIYVYRYFLGEWGDLCFMALDEADNLFGVVICKLERHRGGPMRGYIAMLAVPKKHRGRGIATRLVRMAIDAMIAKDADEVCLETEVVNTAAMKLYERLGFLKSKRLHRYYLNGNSAFRFLLPLKEDAVLGYGDDYSNSAVLPRPPSAG